MVLAGTLSAEHILSMQTRTSCAQRSSHRHHMCDFSTTATHTCVCIVLQHVRRAAGLWWISLSVRTALRAFGKLPQLDHDGAQSHQALCCVVLCHPALNSLQLGFAS